jgi:hypothetical protein
MRDRQLGDSYVREAKYLNIDYMNRKMDLGHFCYVLLFHVTETTWAVSASNV